MLWLLIGVIWGNKINISHTDSLSYMPTLAVKGNKIAVAWTERHEFQRNFDIYYIESEDKGEHWSDIMKIAGEGDASINGLPCVVIDCTDVVHVVWSKNYVDLYWTYQCGDTWATPVNISPNCPGEESWHDVIVDKQNRIWVFWQTYGYDGQCRYTVYDGISWSEPVNFTHQPGGCGAPRVALDTAGNLHVVWSNSTDGYTAHIYYKKYNGIEWSEAEEVPCVEDLDWACDVRIDVDRTDKVWIIWVYNERPYCAYRDTEGWVGPFLVVNEKIIDPDFVIDDNGGLHLCWVGIDCVGRISYVYYSESTDTVWSSPLQISDSIAWDLSMAVDHEGYLYIVWSQRIWGRSPPDCNYDIYFLKGNLTGIEETFTPNSNEGNLLLLNSSKPVINFRLNNPDRVMMYIYNVAGQIMQQIDFGYKSSDVTHAFTITPDMFRESGVYFYYIRTPHETVAKGKLIVIR